MQRRWKLSSAQRADMWNRWKAGQSLNAIGRALGKDKQVVYFLLACHGGIAPPVRRRSRRALTLAEREDISRGMASGCSMRVIAHYFEAAAFRRTFRAERADNDVSARLNRAHESCSGSRGGLLPKICDFGFIFFLADLSSRVAPFDDLRSERFAAWSRYGRGVHHHGPRRPGLRAAVSDTLVA